MTPMVMSGFPRMTPMVVGGFPRIDRGNR